MEYKRRLLSGALSLMVGSMSLVPVRGFAEPPPTVAQARQLFTEALKEQEAGRFAEALVKFQRVQSFRDTSPVRYQIAKCVEGSGRFAKAREMYLRTVDGTQIPSSEDPSVVSASRDAATKLASRVGYVRIDGPAMQDNERLVSVDDDEWAGAGLHEVDPGNHELRVESDDGNVRVVPFAATNMATTAIKLFPTKKPEVAPAPPPVVKAAPQPETSRSISPWAWVSLGAGAAFVGGGVAMLAVREGDISYIESKCPDATCRTSQKDDIESRRSRAGTLGILGVTATAVGAAGLVLGTGLIVFAPKNTTTRVGFAPTLGGAQLVAGGVF